MNWREEDYPDQMIHMWVLQDDIETNYGFESGYPCIYLVSENTSNSFDISQVDLQQVEYIKNNIDSFFTKGIEFLKKN